MVEMRSKATSNSKSSHHHHHGWRIWYQVRCNAFTARENINLLRCLNDGHLSSIFMEAHPVLVAFPAYETFVAKHNRTTKDASTKDTSSELSKFSLYSWFRVFGPQAAHQGGQPHGLAQWH